MKKEVETVTGCNKESLTPPGLNELQNLLYDSEVNYSDYLFGQILAQIKKSGLDKNSIIVLYGDHGEGFDHNYYYAHAENVYQSTIHIPLIIADPQMTKQQKISQLIQNVDLSSLLQKIINKKTDLNTEVNRIKRDMAYSISYGTGKFASISSNGYKYIYSSDDTCLLNNQSEELYKLTSDPKEQNNIIELEPVQAKLLKNSLGEYIQGLEQQLPRAKKDDLGNAIKDLKNQLSTVQEDQNKSTLEDLKSLGY
jgi:arylsulfatase A-like enzyme